MSEQSRPGHRRIWLAVLAALVVALAGAGAAAPTGSDPETAAELQGLSHVTRPGASALKGEDWRTITTSPGQREAAYTRSAVGLLPVGNPREDVPAYYGDANPSTGAACHVPRSVTTPARCAYGDVSSDFEVWVMGASKGGQWVDPLTLIAQREDWRLVPVTKSACAFLPGTHVPDYPQCNTFNINVVARVAAERPDVVVVSPYAEQGSPAQHVSAIDQLLAAGAGHVVVVADSFAPDIAPAACVESKPADVSTCTWKPVDNGAAANNAAAKARAAGDPAVTYLDTNRWLVQEGTGHAVIGGIVTYGSGSHLTSTFTRSMVNSLHAELSAAGLAAHSPDQVQRRSGVDRYATTAEVARPSARVYLASGENYPDALSAGVAESPGLDRASMVLTRKNTVPAVTRAFLASLPAGAEVVIIGDTGAVSSAVAQQVAALGLTTTRVAGGNRYDTNAALAATRVQVPSTVYLANGTAWTDASVGASLGPTMLTTQNRLPAAVKAALADWAGRGTTHVVIVGSTGVVSAAVEAEVAAMGLSVSRQGGQDRYATAVVMAASNPTTTPSFVSGDGWVDAVAAAQLGEPILYVREAAVPLSVRAGLEARPTMTEPSVLGGWVAISPLVELTLADYLG